MENVDCVVVGAGVVGLAVARALALVGREVVVLEALSAIGTQTSSRNSEVVHAGIYYPAGSLKARLCVQGKSMLYDYCESRQVAHRRCGKLIVATHPSQQTELQHIAHRAQANGVHDLQHLSAAQALEKEPALHCLAALYSPSTGIVDSHAFMLSLLADLESAGGVVAFHSTVTRMQAVVGAMEVFTADGTALRARTVVNSAGHGAVELACNTEGLSVAHVPKAYCAKGNYFALAGRSPFSHLIYPVPEKAGLGVHLTLDLAGQAKFGPDVEWVERADDVQVHSARGDVFYAEVRKYWPALADGALTAAYAGVRPKISGPHEAAADFCIQGPRDHGVPGLINLLGIESPGLTSSLAIAQMVCAMCLE